jgi:hypothetical protein
MEVTALIAMARYHVTLDATPGDDPDALKHASDKARLGVTVAAAHTDGGVAIPARVQVEVDAPTGSEAVKAARGFYASLREAAGITETMQEGVAAIQPLTRFATFEIGEMQLFRLAEDLYDQGHYNYAVVAAQTVCELVVEGAMQWAVSRHATERLAKVVPELLSTYSMRDSRGPKVWHALTGRKINEPAELWTNYCKHVARRNEVVHGGKRVSKEEAAHSLDTVRAFCVHITESV